MNAQRFHSITQSYPGLKIALAGDFCLDRYLEIDPALEELSIETGLPVHNVKRIRSQPGGAGTILNNLAALGVGEISLVGMAGEDGEGFELVRALKSVAGVRMDHFIQTPKRRTFTYTKPLLVRAGKTPEELNRLDMKNWDPTPGDVEQFLVAGLRELASRVDAIIVLEQVSMAGTGAVTPLFLDVLGQIAREHPKLLILGDSRRGLAHFPPITLKMNASELAHLLNNAVPSSVQDIRLQAIRLAQSHRNRVIVTLADKGILGAEPDGRASHYPCLPVRGEIDVVGAGDSVTANLTAALAAGASLEEALELANVAASIVIHQLGTTGSASVSQIASILRLAY